jgi:hypothetical protein
MNRCWLGVALVLLWGTGVWGAESRTGSVPDSGQDEVEVLAAPDFVQAALEAEGTGDAANRNQYLQEALDHDPDFAPARWHLGYVQFNNRWLTLSEAQAMHQSDQRLGNYERERTSLADRPDRELKLARWCSDQKLSPQAEFHWRNVLRSEPKHEEALRALDAQWWNGRLVKRGDLAEQKRADYQAKRSTLNATPTLKRRYESMIVRWERLADENESDLAAQMAADLAAESSPNKVAQINLLLGERSRSPRNPQELEQVSSQWMRLLAKEPRNSKLLVMHSIGNPFESARIAAAEALRDQPRQTYIPVFLASLRFPVEFTSNMIATAGLSSVQYTLEMEGLDSDVQIEGTQSLERVAPLDSVIRPPRGNGPQFVRGGFTPEQVAYTGSWQRTAWNKGQAVKSFVKKFNAESEALNKRVTDALARATGEDPSTDPRTWQRWWQEYTAEYYEVAAAPQDDEQQQADNQQQPGQQQRPGNQQRPNQQRPGQQRPMQKFTYTSNQRYFVPPTVQGSLQSPGQRRGSHSCFDPATPVWTLTGPRAIRDIQAGDMILSQHATTGELAYKPVLQVTRTEPSRMMRITVHGESILATRGHPFWVAGKRWTMAKHIQAGDVLHTTSGPLTVDQVEELPAPKSGTEPVCNLEVDDFHTYFVGQNQILVHHLTMLSVLDEGSTVVPGL